MARYDPAYTELADLLESPEVKEGNPAVKEKLERIKDLCDKRFNYADEHTTEVSEVCTTIRKETFTHPWDEAHTSGKLPMKLHPGMVSGLVSEIITGEITRLTWEITQLTGLTMNTAMAAIHMNIKTTLGADLNRLQPDKVTYGIRYAIKMTAKEYSTNKAKFLQFVVSMVRAKTVLELGMFTGYSALAMAEALPADGVLHTCERLEYVKDVASQSFSKSPHGKKIQIHLGNALDTIKKFAADGLKFDVVFLDADKPVYRDYVDVIMEHNMLAPNGTILADNAFMIGRAYTKPETRADNPINDFNNYILSKPELEQVLLPIRDGILAIRRKSEVQGQV